MESSSMLRIREARAGLLLTHPFFGVLSLKLDLIESTVIPTMGVNTKSLVFNPAFSDSLTMSELKGVLAHEVMHLAMLHPMRQGARDKQLWNIACDHVLNLGLLKDGFTLPKDGCMDSQYEGMTSEEVYRKLEQQCQEAKAAGKPSPFGDPGNISTGTFESAGPADSADAGEAEREWTQNANEAIRAASSAGKLPSGLKEKINAALNKSADWEELLKRFMHDQVRTRTTWSKRNKRFPGVILPGKLPDGMGPIVVAVDTSGSIDTALLKRFSDELSALIDDIKPSETHVVYCDAKVHRVESYGPGEPFTMTAVGRGGTDFAPVFDRVLEEGWTPAALVYLTDLDGPFPSYEPEYPVLWAAYGTTAVAPFGDSIHIK